MRRIPVLMLLGCLLVGVHFIKAQESTGPAAEKSKQEVLKIETDKVDNSLKHNGDSAADWFDRYDDEAMIMAGSDGLVETKAQHEARLRSSEVAIISMHQYDHQARVFLDGKVVLLTYKQTGQMVGQSEPHDGVTEDVWINKDGKWVRILHSNQRVAAKKK
jgi:hypothetical protein